ncbi:hypothetical protein [Niastella populi]|uniref:Glycosyltransferase RgtA/B/C/D-like domain-containing protein n=1 Tax=Niastella populi TaxID=550983 RepID=A0A1V9GCE1_9BACT|nr:hypothetical protein [Niastella populi]OQP68240.1 hypothetical protein A4R26_00045 [Niastella populi]
MNILPNAPASKQTFRQFLFHNRGNRIILYVAAAVIVIQFVVFKYLYPFANYIHDDSFRYIEAAYDNLTINSYPIGYSKFLRLVSVVAKPDLALVICQYLLIQCSSLFFLFTVFYFYKAGRVIQTVLFCFMVLNPLFLQLGNMVSSDALFLSLSMTWFALLIWLIYKPSKKIIGWHALVLFLAFTVRYNALIYPFIAALAFGFSPLPVRKKAAGLGLALLLIGWFAGLTMYQYKKLTGYWQFSPFSGWQWSNNAMNVYRELHYTEREPVPPQFHALDNRIRTFFDTHPNLNVVKATPAYMWTPRYPLVQYRDSLFQNDGSATEFKMWAGMGPFYSAYGKYIIKKYPLHFLRHFVLPNAWKYFVPPVEYLENYNWGYPIVQESAVKWFGYSSNQVRAGTKNGGLWSVQYFPWLVSFVNMILFLMLLCYLLLKGWQYNPAFNRIILLVGVFWITYAAFNIFAAPTVLRYQAFTSSLSVIFSLLLIDWLGRLIQHLKTESQQQQPNSEYAQKAIG